jgi:hypothetical protein
MMWAVGACGVIVLVAEPLTITLLRRLARCSHLEVTAVTSALTVHLSRLTRAIHAR